MKKIIFFLLPGFEIMDFAGPLQTFVEARNLGCNLEVVHCAWQSQICAAQNISIDRIHHFSAIVPQSDDIIIIPGMESQPYIDSQLDHIPPAVFSWLKRSYNKGVKLCAICTGAFIIAHAGLLDGKKCTTHWSRTRDLKRLYPETEVRTDRLFVYDRGIYTSAGVAAGIDLSLAIVEENFGPLMASKIARELVVYIRRNGTHHQQSVYMDFRDHINPAVHKVQDYLISHPHEKHTIDALARRFGMSPRNLTRLFKRSTGITVNQYATLIVLEHAKNLLNNPDNTMASIAHQCGFHDAKQLRRLWKKYYGMPPSTQRQRP